MKQSSTEWLIEQLEKHYVNQDLKNTTVFEQAKAIHKEELRKFFSIGWNTRERFDDLVPDMIYPEGLDYEEKQEYAFEQYYKENYGK